MMLAVRKKLGGLHKKLKNESEDNTGKFKAEIGLIQSDQKVTSERIVQIERYLDRLRATNTYGEPIVNFNEDSVTKTELNQTLAEESKKMIKRLNTLRRQHTQKEPEIDDIREDVNLLKDMFKRHQSKID